jgi:MFS family permease
MTGFATFAVGLVPTYASIAIWGAVLLTILRLIQGVGVGGEWGGGKNTRYRCTQRLKKRSISGLNARS